ncbi:MAG: tRNA (adenosine(37)-N6)-threonylcarbamoyltransferase complex ATPase subunit type 1 TsaE [Treponema sp.]|nr:tRNA (adenosine(37)-N6)-threonylcarbamoyltransferase complex ATPase subunit type 1 TsaE [Treponema sp.]
MAQTTGITAESSSPQATRAIGKSIAAKLGKGSVVSLRGPLGAGKTVLVKGIAEFFGIEEEITSPTYTIVSEYRGNLDGSPIEFWHIDAYRLKGEDDFTAIGGEEYIYGSGISVIEWSERISGLLPAGAVMVEIEICGGDNRIIRVSGV